MVYGILDLETTGTDSSFHEIIEISLFILNSNDFTIVNRFTSRLCPQHTARIEPEIINITGITLDTMLSSPSQVQVRGAFLNFWQEALDGEKILLIGQNIQFDIGFLKEFLQYQFEDIFAYYSIDIKSIFEFAKLAGHLPEDFSTKLIELADYYNVPFKAHRSSEDCYAVLELLQILKNRISFDLLN